MVDTRSRRMTVQAAVAAGLLVAGLLLIARPSSQPATVTTHFETVAHSKLSKIEKQGFPLLGTFANTPANGFVPQACNYSMNITATAQPVYGLCNIVNNNPFHCCTYDPVPEDTTGCPSSCAAAYISYFCFAACSTGNTSCSSSVFNLYTLCNVAGCNVLQNQQNLAFSAWLAAQNVSTSSNTATCNNFTATNPPPCVPTAAPVVSTLYAHFVTTAVGGVAQISGTTGGFIFANGSTTAVGPITSAQQFGVGFNVYNPVVSSCSIAPPPVKATVLITLVPSDSQSTTVLLGNFTLWSPQFNSTTTPSTTAYTWQTDTATWNNPTPMVVQIDPTTGSGTVTVTVVAYNLVGQSSPTSFSFSYTASTACQSITCGPALVIPNGFTYSPDDTVSSVYLSNLTLLGNNIIDGRGASPALIVGQISFPDNTSSSDSVTLKNIDIMATNLTFGAGGRSNTIYLINSVLVLTGQTSTDSAQLCICGDSRSQFILNNSATFIVNNGNAATGLPNNLVFCGRIQAVVEPGAVVSIVTPAAPPANGVYYQGIGVIDGATLINYGNISLQYGIAVVYTTGAFVNNGTLNGSVNYFVNSAPNVGPIPQLYVIAGTYNETNTSTVVRYTGAPTTPFLQNFTTCEPGLVITAPAVVLLCGTNGTNLTIGANTQAVVGNELVCNTNGVYNGTIEAAAVWNLIVGAGGVVVFSNVNGNQGILIVYGVATWAATSVVAFTLVPTINNVETFIPLIVCINQPNINNCCNPPPGQNTTVQQNGITAVLACLAFGSPGYPFTGKKFMNQGVLHPAVLGVVISKYISPPPAQVNTAIYTSLNTYCIEINENPQQFPQSQFLGDIQSTLGISQNFVNILLYATDAATGFLKVTYTCNDYSSSAAADVTCQTIQNQALNSGTPFNIQVQGQNSCGVQVNQAPNAHQSNKALFALFALACIPLLLCFLVLLLIINKRRAADNQYMQDTATFSNVASSPQNVAYAAPSEKYYPSYPTPTPIGYYP